VPRYSVWQSREKVVHPPSTRQGLPWPGQAGRMLGKAPLAGVPSVPARQGNMQQVPPRHGQPRQVLLRHSAQPYFPSPTQEGRIWVAPRWCNIA
jgi:hypothetical protein